MSSATGFTGNVSKSSGGDKPEAPVPTSVKFPDKTGVRLVKAAAGLCGMGAGAFIAMAAVTRAREELTLRGINPATIEAEVAGEVEVVD
jgi:hypothetical protein